MLAIRLARTGKKHQAYFRIVVSDSHRTPTAKFIEILGNYDPHAKKFQIKKDRLEHYLKNGAQPSNSVAKLLLKEKIELPKWVKISEKKRAPKKTAEVKEPAKKDEEKIEPVEGAETDKTDAPIETSGEKSPEKETEKNDKSEKAEVNVTEEKVETKEESPSKDAPKSEDSTGLSQDETPGKEDVAK